MSVSDYAQFITVLILFVVVLFLAAYVTKKIGKFSNAGNKGTNISIIESYRISAGSYVQILKIGTKKYVAIAVCKDSVTKLAELSEDELTRYADVEEKHIDFKSILEQLGEKKNSGNGDK